MNSKEKRLKFQRYISVLKDSSLNFKDYSYNFKDFSLNVTE